MWSTLSSVKVAPFTVSVVKRLVLGFFQDLHGFYDTQDIHQHDAAAQRPAMDMARYGWVFLAASNSASLWALYHNENNGGRSMVRISSRDIK